MRFRQRASCMVVPSLFIKVNKIPTAVLTGASQTLDSTSPVLPLLSPVSIRLENRFAWKMPSGVSILPIGKSSCISTASALSGMSYEQFSRCEPAIMALLLSAGGRNEPMTRKCFSLPQTGQTDGQQSVFSLRMKILKKRESRGLRLDQRGRAGSFSPFRLFAEGRTLNGL